MMRAQSITSYTCDFENAAENAQWSLNKVAAGYNLSQCANKWYIGPAGGFGVGTAASSSAGLYISSGTDIDTLISSYSSSQSVFIAASRELPLAAGTYSAVFDWQAMGADAKDGIYVFWVESGTTYYNMLVGNWTNRTSLALPPYVTNATRYGGTDLWRSSAFSFTTAGNGGRLVVLWLNTLTAAVQPAGKLDNICIYQGSQCTPPTNVRYDGNTKSVRWNGSAASYDVMLYNYNTQRLTTYNGVTGNSMQMPNLSEEGYYYIYVRSVCDDGHSTWIYTETFVWIKGARCIDLFDIGPSLTNAGVCYVGDFDTFIRNGQQGTLGRVDNGSRDPSSMQTIHIDRNEIDPNTHVNGGLHTVPPGEIASVRLGAYTSSGQSSRIEYKYTVQPGMSDLLDLQYAVVMESGGHGSSLSDGDMNPTFTLNILDAQGNAQDACAQRYFVAGFGDQRNWHQEGDWYWCNWSKVTVSLRQYVGQTITIRLTSARCSYDTHPAYAYFTMNCRGGDLQGVACGDFSTDHFEAPEGFNYRWYRADDPNKTVLSTDRIFNIASNDPTIYLVDVIDKNANGCFYVLEANPNPRFPQARAKMKSTEGVDCTNKVNFESECHVVRINRQTLDSLLTEEEVESILWDFGDGSAPLNTLDANVHHDYPPEGGEYDVKVTAKMSGGICSDTYTLHLSLPNLIPADDVQYTHYCEPGEDYTDTTYATAPTGCEQRKLHHHRHHLPFDTLYTDRFCEGGRYFFPGTGRYYTQSIDTTVNLKSVYGCDSTIRLSLIVDPKLMVEYPSALEICYDDRVISIPYTVTSGALDSVHVYFSAEAQKYGFEPVYAFGRKDQVVIAVPKNARPDRYPVQLDFSSERCAMPIQTVEMTLMYSASVVMQTGGFIGVQNANYNGGYNFTAFDWYKDGVQLNHHASYIPAGPDDFGSVYVVYLTREGETQPLQTCPIVYNPYAQDVDLVADGPSVWPTCVSGGAELHLAPQACTIYTVLGTVVAHYPQALETRTIAAPSQAGVYVVVFDNKKSSRILVR